MTCASYGLWRVPVGVRYIREWYVELARNLGKTKLRSSSRRRRVSGGWRRRLLRTGVVVLVASTYVPADPPGAGGHARLSPDPLT